MVLPPKYCLSSCQLSPLYVTYRENLNVQKGHGFHHQCIQWFASDPCGNFLLPTPRRNVAEATNARHVFGAADLGLLSCEKIWDFQLANLADVRFTSNKLIGRSLGLCTTQKVLLPESSLAAKFAANLVLGSILSVAILGYTLDLGISRIYLKTWRSIKICLKQDQPFCGNSHHIKHLHTAPYT